MSSITETRTLVDEIVDNADERELWIVGRLFERPPYFHAGKGGDTRLARALRVCVEGRITPNSDGSYTVEGSEKRTYRCAESCSCPYSQQSKSKWCYHMCAVALYVEWQRRIRPARPVALGTLRAGTLPLPPTTVDERLATSVALGTMHDSTALQTHHTPQEDGYDVTQEELMASEEADDAQYIPEPNVPPVAVVDAPERKEEKKESTRPLPGPVLLPSLDARTLEQSMQAWAEQRAVVKRFLQQELQEGSDFYSLRIKGRDTKPVLSKAGSEKFLGLLQLSATFTQDVATWTMLGNPEGTLCYVCTLHTRSGEMVGEGRGARTIGQDGGDINKAIKMACKSAQVDAILRTGALSDCFTQDLEDTAPEPVKSAQPSADLRRRIWNRMKELYPAVHSREDAETWIKTRTGMVLHPDNYVQILAHLEQEG